MIDPKDVCFFHPRDLGDYKNKLFERIGRHIKAKGGKIIRHDARLLDALPDEIIPIVGCTPELRSLINDWQERKRTWIYWDRSYIRRIFAAGLPRGENGGYYRWTVDAFQMKSIRDVPDDRWKALLPGNKADRMPINVLPWQQHGRHIVIAVPSDGYAAFHDIENWLANTVTALKELTCRPLVTRFKKDIRPLRDDLKNAHCLVTHGSIAAVEAVILGYPVFVHTDSAAALVGLTDLSQIETPVYPERQLWLNSLAYSQYTEKEMVDGSLWKLLA